MLGTVENQVDRNTDQISSLWERYYELNTEIKVLCVEMKNVAASMNKLTEKVDNLTSEIKESNRIKETPNPPNVLKSLSDELKYTWFILRIALVMGGVGLLASEIISRYGWLLK